MKTHLIFRAFIAYFICFFFCISNLLASSNCWLETKKLTASDAEEDNYFGRSVDVSGDTVVVGAASDIDPTHGDGKAYIYERNFGGANSWGELKILNPTGGESFPDFGVSVAIDGDIVIVGAPSEDSIFHDEGAAYIFARNEGGQTNWGQVKRLVISNALSAAYFGKAVDVNGDIAIVGAYGHTSVGSLAGAAYIFECDACSTNPCYEVEKLIAHDAEDGDRFGGSVSIDGNIAVVGAASKKVGAVNSAGAVYVFERHTHFWEQVKKITRSNPEAGDYFGSRVAVAGDTIAIGSPGTKTSNSQSGVVHVYERNAGGTNAWGRVKKLIPVYEYPGRTDFGASLAIDGNVIIAGASTTDEGSMHVAGVAYVFERNAGGTNNWGQVKKLISSDLDKDDRFGFSVAIDGNTAVAGAVYEKSGGTNAGAVYVFDGYDVPPASDTFEDAGSLTGDIGIADGNNTNATVEPNEPAHAGNGGPYHSVWWDWQGAAGAFAIENAEGDALLIDTSGSDFDTVLAVYTGLTVSNLTVVATNDNAEAGIETSEVYFQYSPGENYHIVVDGKTELDTGNIVLNYAAVPETNLYILFYFIIITCYFFKIY